MDFVGILKIFVEIFPQVVAGLLIAAIMGLAGYGCLLYRRRQRLALDVIWRHRPASPNFATAKAWEMSNPEIYLADFTLTNLGESVSYLGRIEISAEDGSGAGVALSEQRYNNAREGRTQKAIGFPEALNPRQIFTFTHSFSRAEFQEMVERQHYLTVGSARPFKLKIHTKL